MNIRSTSSGVVAFLIVSSVLFCAIARAASTLPLISVLSERDQVLNKRITVSGVLGFASDCQYVLYANRNDAAQRAESRGLRTTGLLSPEVRIGRDLSPESVIGKYIIVSGEMKKAANKENPYTFDVTQFENVIGSFGGKSKCDIKDGSGNWLDFGDIFSKGPEKIGSIIKFAGILGEYHELGLVVFSDGDASASEVWTNGVILRIKDDPKGDHARKWKKHIGEYVIVSGVLEKSVGLSGFSYRVADSTVKLFSEVDR